MFNILSAGLTLADGATYYFGLGGYNVATGRFTSSSGGYYQINANILFSSVAWTAGQTAQIRIVTNESTPMSYVIGRATVQVSMTFSLELQGSVCIYLPAGNYFSLLAFHNRGTATTLYNNSEYNFISIHKLSSL